MKPLICSLLLVLSCPVTALADDMEKDTKKDTVEDIWRPVDPENLIVFTTNKGPVLIEMAPDFAPFHAKQIRAIVRAGHYDGTIFHRVIENFMAQGGDVRAKNGKGSGLPNIEAEFVFRRDPSKQIGHFLGDPEKGARQAYVKGFPIYTQPEFLSEITKDGRIDSWIRHCPGIVSMARTNDPNSANSQFFLVTHTSPWLDRKYTAWGRIIHGLDVVKSLNKGQPPDKPDMLISAKMAADLPVSKRPKIAVMRSDSKAFQNILDDAIKAKTADICDLPAVKSRIEPYKTP